MTKRKYNTEALHYQSRMLALQKVIRSARTSPPEELRKAQVTILNYLVDHTVKREDGEEWVENRTKRVLLGIYDAVAEPIRTGIGKSIIRGTTEQLMLLDCSAPDVGISMN